MSSVKISIHDITFKFTFYQIKYANFLTNSTLQKYLLNVLLHTLELVNIFFILFSFIILKC